MTKLPALCIVGGGGIVVFGCSSEERLRRQFARAGVTRVIGPDAAVAESSPVIAVRADAVLDQPLVTTLLEVPGLLLTGESQRGQIEVAAHARNQDVAAAIALLRDGAALPADTSLTPRAPRDLDVEFWKALRKRQTPYAIAAAGANLAAVEWRVFMGTYKGATDFVTKHLWPIPAFHVTRWLATRGVTPNAVTTAGALATLIAFWLFLRGDFGLGLAAAWLMTFLDTVDGKLARTTLTSSKWGDIFDHGIDLIHPPFWYVAWGLGLGAAGIVWSAVTFWWVMAAILGGYLAQRIMEGIAIKWLGLEIHIWRKRDTLFRQITARRNPNLALLTLATIVGRPDWGLLWVAGWTLICLALHALQLAEALSARRRGPLVSWMTQG